MKESLNQFSESTISIDGDDKSIDRVETQENKPTPSDIIPISNEHQQTRTENKVDHSEIPPSEGLYTYAGNGVALIQMERGRTYIIKPGQGIVGRGEVSQTQKND